MYKQYMRTSDLNYSINTNTLRELTKDFIVLFAMLISNNSLIDSKNKSNIIWSSVEKY